VILAAEGRTHAILIALVTLIAHVIQIVIVTRIMDVGLIAHVMQIVLVMGIVIVILIMDVGRVIAIWGAGTIAVLVILIMGVAALTLVLPTVVVT
jgi:hypothetical protein